MKKINLLVITLLFFVTQTMVFGNNLQKPVLNTGADRQRVSANACPQSRQRVSDSDLNKKPGFL